MTDSSRTGPLSLVAEHARRGHGSHLGIRPSSRYRKCCPTSSGRMSMKCPRFSLSGLAFAILVLAIDLAVIRSAIFGRDPVSWSIFALLLLPMLDALLFALFRLRKPERRTTRSIAFLLTGTTATLVVLVILRDCTRGRTALAQDNRSADRHGEHERNGSALRECRNATLVHATDVRHHIRDLVPDRLVLLPSLAQRSHRSLDRLSPRASSGRRIRRARRK